MKTEKKMIMKDSICLWRMISILLASLCALNGCAKDKLTPAEEISQYTSEMREAVSVNIKDSTRRAQVLNLIARMDVVMQDYSRAIQIFVNSSRKLDENYNTSRQSYNSLNDKFTSQRKQAQEEIFDLHFKTVALLTEDEWNRVVKYEEKAIEATIEAREPQEEASK